MNWPRVTKGTPPETGTKYSEWREELRAESSHRCIYCAIHEAQLGGLRGFHIEHYRPKSRFPDLEHNYANLYYACCICNVFKGNDWPSDPADDHSVCAYPDPGGTDYNEIFSVTDDHVTADTVAGRYVVTRIFLNRPQLIMERRTARLERGLLDLIAWAQEVANAPDQVPTEILREVIVMLSRAIEVQVALRHVPPYERQDVSRQ